MYNFCFLIGRIVTDIELKYTTTGTAVANTRLAVDRQKRSDEEKQTDFFNVVLWGKSAEFAANYLSKGRLVAVQGRMQVRSYNKQDGTKVTVTEVVGERVLPLDKPKDKEQAASADNDLSDYDPFAE